MVWYTLHWSESLTIIIPPFLVIESKMDSERIPALMILAVVTATENTAFALGISDVKN